MTEVSRKLARFFHEVWRRHVLQIALPYCVGGWLLIEISDVVLGAFEAPNWILQVVLIAFLTGLPIVIALAWIFDITPAGLVRTGSVKSDDIAVPEPAPAMTLSMGGSERRQVTMLCCAFDLSQGEDPEEDPELLHDAIASLEGVIEDIVERFEAYRLPGLAEDLTLVFGYPAALDHDARRAVAAGLALVKSAGRLDQNHNNSADLSARIGIHTGLVVVDESRAEERMVTFIGQVPRFTAWLQSIAPAGAVVISKQTSELVSGVYACVLLGEFKHPQHDGNVEVFQAKTGAPSAQKRGSLLHIGREQELAQLQARWDHAVDGDGQFVLIKGEPGIGKSSLLHAFQHSIAESGAAWILLAQCSSYEQNTAMHPIMDALRGQVLGFEPGDSNGQKLQKLEVFVKAHAHDVEDALPILARLLSLPLQPGAHASDDSPQQVRARTLELLLHIIRQEALKRPVLFVLEDMLWADPTTLEWIRMMVEEGPSNGVFLLLTARPAFTADWTSRSYVMVMDLLPLASRSARELVLRSSGDIELPAALIARIIEETGGNPLYVHELTRAIIESGEWKDAPDLNRSADLSWMKIPATLQDSLAARIDHLGPAKALLQLCSILGREFDYDQLRAVSGTENEAALKKELATILQSELLFQRGSSTNPTYSFKHVLIQETAYNSLLKSTRKELHLRTATIIEQEYPVVAEQRPALLAWHHGEAGNVEKAVALWTLAARQSLAAFANQEAITQTRRGLDWLAELPASGHWAAQEVALQSVLGMAQLATRGYAAPEVRQAFTRAQELCEKLGDAPQLFQVVVGLWMYYTISAQYEQALEHGQTLVRIAETTQDPAQILQGRYCLGFVLYYRGEYHAALAHLEDAMQGEVNGFDYASQSASGDDTRSHVRILLAFLSWHLGEPRNAVKLMQQAVDMADKLGHPYGITFVGFSAAWLHVLRQDVKNAMRLARPAIEVAEDKGYRFFQPLAQFMLTWAEGRESKSSPEPRGTEVAEQLQACIDRFRSTGALAGYSFQVFTLVEDLITLGNYELAQQQLGLAWSHVEKSGEWFFAPEYYRLQGRLCQHRDRNPEAAIECFRKALERSRRMESKALELRAANDLAQALAAIGELEESIQLLAGVRQRSVEPDDSGDFRRNEQLLKELKRKNKT